LAHLKVFSCTLYVHIDAEHRNKLDAKSRRCTFIGYGQHDFDYRFWDAENRKIIRSKDVVFNEKVMHKDSVQVTKAKEKGFVELEELPDTGVTTSQDDHALEHYETEPHTPVVRRSTRERRPTVRYSPSLYYLLLTDNGEPECFEEVLQSDTRVKWEQAMDEEMDSLKSNRTWELVTLPKGKKDLHNKWVYRL
ncbi:hypothetical protein PJI17_30930, partial [Mycobacterium kansasii]